MKHRTDTTRRQAGVTLVEMMVALAITSFVILVVNQIFNEVIQTVGRGTQGGEILQKARTLDEQLATETELVISDLNAPGQWRGRMVGPSGRGGPLSGDPGGFLAIIQHEIAVPLTLTDALKDNTDPTKFKNIRSDQLMFIYDQRADIGVKGSKLLPPLAPSSVTSFAGDMTNSINAEYIRMWYGHAVQVPEDRTVNFNPIQHDLGVQNAGNPNALAQDWVLGRQALFLTGWNPIPTSSSPPRPPIGAHANGISVMDPIVDGPIGKRLWQGFADVSILKLEQITDPATGLLGGLPNSMAYQGQVAAMLYVIQPLLTGTKPGSADLTAEDMAPSHSYLMGGVSDFIVEWAGDVVNGTMFLPTLPSDFVPDGELDRDPDGRIKWYTSPRFANPPGPLFNPFEPTTYPTPPPVANYLPNAGLLTAFNRVDDAFIWQHAGSNEFTQWPWMLRIRYRLHDRRGEFEGRQALNPATGEIEPEAGKWFETIIPVNHQGIR